MIHVSVIGKLKYLLKYHLHIVLYSYFCFGLAVCGLVAPEWRVAELGSRVITKGWHLSLAALALLLVVSSIYIVRMRERPLE